MVLNLILPVLVDIVKNPIKQYIVTPITRRVSYVFNCSSKVQALQSQVEQLRNKKDRLQQSVNDATRNGEEIYPNVTTWLSSADQAIEDGEELLQQKEEAKKKCLVGLCPNFKSRYLLSKKAVIKASAIDKLRNEEDLDSISFRPPLQQIVEPSVYNHEALPSRVFILNQIMDALRDPNLNMLGVHGMPGVGKTTLTKEVQGKAVNEKLFDDVIVVVVSQTPELRRIQSEIADFLGVKFYTQELPGRASQLYERLEKSKVLIILDDLWQKLDLNAVGIPFGGTSKDCKLMLTSRHMDLLSGEMRVQKLFPLEVLKEDETWSLFEMSVVEANDPKFHVIATEIAKKCAGLPLLIQLVATELQNKESYVWKDKLNQLSAYGDGEIYERVHEVVESSYDDLPGEEIKSFFLLCSMFGQSNIRIQYLLTHSMGLGLFKHIRNVGGARAKVLTLIGQLKARNLLLDGDMTGFIKMHDIVRDTALSIASRVQHAFIGSGEVRLSDWPNRECRKISFPYYDVRELPVCLDCPEAELFLLFAEDLCLEIPDSFFEWMNKLKVVDFMGMRMVSLPLSIGLLTNLQTLSLHRCRLDNVAMVGMLEQLESLSFANSKIGELPREISALTRLKVLDLTDCTDLTVIPENVFSKLRALEELYMLNSFVQWNAKGHASLVELDSLSHLSTLEIHIVDSKLIAQSHIFFDGLRSYKISIGDEWGYWGGNNGRSRTLKLKLDAWIHLEDGIKLLLKGAEELYLSEGKGIGSILYDLDREGFPQLKHLHVQNDFCIQHLIRSTRWASCAAFPILESLHLYNLMSLENICYGQLEMRSFGELRSVKIIGCDKLKSLFSFSSTKCLPHLQEMEVESCENMDAVVDEGSEGEHYNNEVIEFIQLSSLKLKHLPNLTSFCKREVGTTPKELLFNEMVSFPNLTSLEVSNCKSLKYVFAASMVECLPLLKMLDISDCELVEEVMQSNKDEEIEEESIKAIVFPNLDYLRLGILPNVKMFSCGYSVEFPLLRELRIETCQAMKNFVSKYSSNESDQEEYFFNEMVTFSNLEIMQVNDMNFKYLWDEQLFRDDDGDSFCKLISLKIVKCSKLLVVFPSVAYRRFHRLERLFVSCCDGVKEIYGYQGINFKEVNKVEAFSLRDLWISNLQSLKNIWSNDLYGALAFENLQVADVWDCKGLNYVFPASIARALFQLQKLKVSDCENLEVIIAKEKDESSDPSFQFPELTKLKLNNLKKMRSSYEGFHTFKCPKLKSLEVRELPNVLVEEFIGNLEELRIDGQGFNAILHNGEFSVELLCKLRKLTLEYLQEESIPVVFGFLRRLKSLEMLVFKFCFLEEIVFELDTERPTGDEQLHHLISLKHLELRDIWKLKHIIKKTDSKFIRILQRLHTLIVNGCDDLMNVAPSSASFQNLTTLRVGNCSNMTILVTTATAKTMVQLVELKVEDCNRIEEIVTKDDGNDTEHDRAITFRKLKRLELQDLPKVNSFCSNSRTFNFPLLEQVIVDGCPRMKIFCSGDLITPRLREILFEGEQQWEENLNATIASQLREWVGDHFEEAVLFENVESLQVVKDAICSKAVSANQMQLLNKLTKITVRDCASLQVVFDLEQLSSKDGHGWLLPQLNELELINLPMLTQLCNKAPMGILDFNKLKVLKLDNCCRLEYVVTRSMASCLFQLREIEVKNCEMMETIIKEEEAGDASAQMICIGSLESIIVECLPKFSSIYSGIGDLECPSLEKISIRECPSIKSFISRLTSEDRQGKKELNVIHFSYKVFLNLSSYSTSFENLTTLEVHGCNQLRNLIPSSVAKSMVQLETLRIESCKMLMEIVQDSNDGTTEIVFANMTTLELVDLQSLESFSLGNSTFEFPYLEEVAVRNCPNMRAFCPGSISTPMLNCVQAMLHKYRTMWGDYYWEGNLSNTIEHIYKTMVGFKGLKDVELSIFPTLRENWGDHFPFKNFFFLQSLVVDDCAIISNAIPSHLLQYLKRLKVLIVKKCDLLEQVLDLEGLNAAKFGIKGMENLDEMHLIDLPKLAHVWSKDPQQILSFENLQLLKVHNCGNLIFIFDLSMALCLPKLQYLEVKNCSLVKHIVAQGEDEEMQKYHTTFPSLQSINIQYLTNLLSFYSASEFLECPSLKMIEVFECPNMKFFGSMPSNELDSCMIPEENDELISSEIMFLGNKVAIPGLEELKLQWNKVKDILYIDNQPDCLHRLKCIELTGFQGEEHAVLPSNFLQYFRNLEKLALRDALIEEVNLHELSCTEVKDEEALASLTKLKLSNLPKLKHLVHDDAQLVPLFQNLEDLEVVECSRLEILVPSVVSFQNLTNLQVSDCDGLINLMTASTARSLVQLKSMSVKDCKMMQGIVGIASNEVEYEIRFSQLEYLELNDMRCLTSFCSGNYIFHFPSLKEVIVIGCPDMKIFILQVPTAPNLRKVRTGTHDYDWEWEGNLNNTVQTLSLGKSAQASSSLQIP